MVLTPKTKICRLMTKHTAAIYRKANMLRPYGFPRYEHYKSQDNQIKGIFKKKKSLMLNLLPLVGPKQVDASSRMTVDVSETPSVSSVCIELQ